MREKGRKSGGAAARPEFGSVACLDFSARSTPSPVRAAADACWFGVVGEEAAYERTRAGAWDRIAAWAGAATVEGPALLGVDFALGFPAGTAAALGVGDRRGVWMLLADEVVEGERNANNRFEVAAGLNKRVGNPTGPWWGCPTGTVLDHLGPRMGFGWPVRAYSGHDLSRMRRTDLACPGVQEVWKLMGAGSVGSQTLLGIAGLERLRLRLRRDGIHLRVWPFERHDAPAAGELWVAECWPGLVADRWRSAVESGMVRDAAQVAAWAEWAGEEAAGLWDRPLPEEAAEEGWILGVDLSLKP